MTALRRIPAVEISFATCLKSDITGYIIGELRKNQVFAPRGRPWLSAVDAIVKRYG